MLKIFKYTEVSEMEQIQISVFLRKPQKKLVSIFCECGQKVPEVLKFLTTFELLFDNSIGNLLAIGI